MPQRRQSGSNSAHGKGGNDSSPAVDGAAGRPRSRLEPGTTRTRGRSRHGAAAADLEAHKKSRLRGSAAEDASKVAFDADGEPSANAPAVKAWLDANLSPQPGSGRDPFLIPAELAT